MKESWGRKSSNKTITAKQHNYTKKPEKHVDQKKEEPKANRLYNLSVWLTFYSCKVTHITIHILWWNYLSCYFSPFFSCEKFQKCWGIDIQKKRNLYSLYQVLSDYSIQNVNISGYLQILHILLVDCLCNLYKLYR